LGSPSQSPMGSDPMNGRAQSETRGAVWLRCVLGFWHLEIFLNLLFDPVLILSNPNHLVLIYTV
jgi:hypothetical protein